MPKRLKTKIGDLFSIAINAKEKKYVQLVAIDPLQLNSDVIRCFNKIYDIEFDGSMETIIEDDVMFYAHCIVDFGLKLKVFSKVGSSLDIGNPQNVIFKSTDDYGRGINENPILISNNWYLWKITDEKFRKIGKLEGDSMISFNGMVFNPYGILELARGNEYPPNYPK